MKTDALERLRELRAGREPYRTPDDLPDGWRELYEERAAIRIHDGRQHPEHAEAEALREVLDRMRAADI